MKEDIQKKLMQLQVLQVNLQAIQEREGIVVRHFEELQNTRLAIEEMGKIKADEALVPIGAGNFVKGKITDTDNMIVGMGSSVAINKTRKQALEIINERIKEVENVLEELAGQAESAVAQMTKLDQEVQKMKG